ncbi:MAG: hypothetical protein ACYCVD_14775 [Desulfitobacteriaceae bacterium]
MIGKWISILLGAVLWGLGANIDFGVAFGFGGTAAFLIVALLTIAILWKKGFRSGKSGLELWILILRGLAWEALLFPVASLILGLFSPQALGPGVNLKTLLIYSGLLGGFLAVVFLFNVHLLITRIKPLQEESRKHIKPRKDS